MDTQTSFIPKRTLDTQTRIQRADTVSIFTILSTALFFITIVAGGGMFLWQKNLQTQVSQVETDLVKESEAFSRDTIQGLTDLSNRLNSSEQLLNNRLYASKIFTLLNQNTIKTVRFSKFSIDPSAVDKTKIKMNVSGQAKDYASVALQSDVFSKLTNSIMNYEFSNLTLDQAGNVLFDMSATLDKKTVAFDAFPEVVNYTQQLSTPINTNTSPENFFPSEGGDFFNEGQESFDTTIN